MNRHLRSSTTSRAHRAAGFTLLESTIVLMIIAAMIAMAVPMLTSASGAGDLRATAVDLTGMLNRARSEAIRTGEVHIVFVGSDAGATGLVDLQGNSVDIMILNDGPSGSTDQDCQISPGEDRLTLPSFPTTISPGVAATVPAAPNDQGTGLRTVGSTFTDPSGNAATWVMFRADGVPLAFDDSCTIGTAGSGAGAIYISDGRRIASVVLRPLGGARAHVLDTTTNTWIN
jgi:type II secretory pathway pseudopilin PulG